MIYCYLTPGEFRHYSDLYNGLGCWKLTGNESPAELRERQLVALSSVVPQDDPRARIGADEVQVHNKGHDSNIPRWT